MKKTYISPELITVRLAMSHPLATSQPIIGIGTTSCNAGDLDAREYNNTVRDVNLWDNEW